MRWFHWTVEQFECWLKRSPALGMAHRGVGYARRFPCAWLMRRPGRRRHGVPGPLASREPAVTSCGCFQSPTVPPSLFFLPTPVSSVPFPTPHPPLPASRADSTPTTQLRTNSVGPFSYEQKAPAPNPFSFPTPLPLLPVRAGGVGPVVGEGRHQERKCDSESSEITSETQDSAPGPGA